MGKGAFKKYIKNDGAPAPVVYDDVSIYRTLRIHRRVIASARTKNSRGKDWACVDRHAGMTMEWIEREALKRGIVPDFINNPLKPIEPGDNVVSCKLVGTWPNRTRVTVEVVATGEVRIATVPNADDFHLYEIFDAYDYGSELTWTAKLNDARY